MKVIINDIGNHKSNENNNTETVSINLSNVNDCNNNGSYDNKSNNNISKNSTNNKNGDNINIGVK